MKTYRELLEANTTIYQKGDKNVEVTKEGHLWVVIANGTEVFAAKSSAVANKFAKDYKFGKDPNLYKNAVRYAQDLLDVLEDKGYKGKLESLIKIMKASKSKETIEMAWKLMGDLEDHINENEPDAESEFNNLWDTLEDIGAV